MLVCCVHTNDRIFEVNDPNPWMVVQCRTMARGLHGLEAVAIEIFMCGILIPSLFGGGKWLFILFWHHTLRCILPLLMFD